MNKIIDWMLSEKCPMWVPWTLFVVGVVTAMSSIVALAIID